MDLGDLIVAQDQDFQLICGLKGGWRYLFEIIE